MYGLYLKRNEPITLDQVQPLPEPKKVCGTGNAGLDGYTTLARADRETGAFPLVGGVPVRRHPRMNED